MGHVLAGNNFFFVTDCMSRSLLSFFPRWLHYFLSFYFLFEAIRKKTVRTLNKNQENMKMKRSYEPDSYQRLDLFINVLRVLCPNLTDASFEVQPVDFFFLSLSISWLHRALSEASVGYGPSI